MGGANTVGWNRPVSGGLRWGELPVEGSCDKLQFVDGSTYWRRCFIGGEGILRVSDLSRWAKQWVVLQSRTYSVHSLVLSARDCTRERWRYDHTKTSRCHLCRSCLVGTIDQRAAETLHRDDRAFHRFSLSLNTRRLLSLLWLVTVPCCVGSDHLLCNREASVRKL